MNQQNNIYYYYNRLPSSGRMVYDQILDGLKSMDPEIACSAYNFEEINRIYELLLADHPELYWVDGGWKVRQRGSQFTLIPEYSLNISEVHFYDRHLSKVLSGFDAYRGRCKTDVELLEKAFRYIVENVKYVRGAPQNQTIISALINHESVCAGYSKSLQFLLQNYGIECLFVYGTTRSRGGQHAWNIVNLGGDYYHTDVTFGDRSFTDGEMVKHGIPRELEAEYAFLCMSDNEALRDRSMDTVGGISAPRCTHTELSWYRRRGLYFTTPKGAWEHIQKQLFAGQTYWQCQFATNVAYSSFNRDITKGKFADLALDILSRNRIATKTCRDDDTRYVAGWIE